MKDDRVYLAMPKPRLEPPRKPTWRLLLGPAAAVLLWTGFWWFCLTVGTRHWHH